MAAALHARHYGEAIARPAAQAKNHPPAHRFIPEGP
jgi:hypothetical protein